MVEADVPSEVTKAGRGENANNDRRQDGVTELPSSPRQDNPNHIFMLQAQIQTLYRLMDKQMASNTSAAGTHKLQETLEDHLNTCMADSNRSLSATMEAELNQVKLEMEHMKADHEQEMKKMRHVFSNQLDAMEQKIQQRITMSTQVQSKRNDEDERSLKQAKHNQLAEKYTQLEAKLEACEVIANQVDMLQRQVASQQKQLQICQRRLREMQMDRDEKTELLATFTSQPTRDTYRAAISEPQEEQPSSLAAKAKLRLYEKRQQSVKFRETLNHMKFMSEGAGTLSNSKQKNPGQIGRGGRLRESHERPETRNPSNEVNGTRDHIRAVQLRERFEYK